MPLDSNCPFTLKHRDGYTADRGRPAFERFRDRRAPNEPIVPREANLATPKRNQKIEGAHRI